jgi:hypothetical protein
MMENSVFYMDKTTRTIKRIQIGPAVPEIKFLAFQEKQNHFSNQRFSIKPFFDDQVHITGFGMFNVDF